MPADLTTPRARNLALALLALTQFVVVIDASIVNVALPSVGTALDISQDHLSWVVNAYVLAFGGFLLLGGRLADFLGRRRMFVAGIALFTIASLLGGLAQNETWLIVARALQGLGAAIASPAALSIVTTTFAEGTERNRALAIWGAVAGAGGADRTGWTSATTLLRGLGAVALLAAFTVVEGRSRGPLLPLSTFSLRTLRGANVVGLLVGMALVSMFFLITLYLQQVLGFSALAAGFAYLPMSVSIIVAATAASTLVTRLGFKPVLMAGLAFVALGRHGGKDPPTRRPGPVRCLPTRRHNNGTGPNTLLAARRPPS